MGNISLLVAVFDLRLHVSKKIKGGARPIFNTCVEKKLGNIGALALGFGGLWTVFFQLAVDLLCIMGVFALAHQGFTFGGLKLCGEHAHHALLLFSKQIDGILII